MKLNLIGDYFLKGMIFMEWYKSVEFWLGIIVTLAFFQLFFDRTFGVMWWTNLISTIIGMLLILRSFKKFNIK